MKKLIILAMALIATAGYAQQPAEKPLYEQDETIKIWDNKTAPHSNELEGKEHFAQPMRLVNVVDTAFSHFRYD